MTASVNQLWQRIMNLMRTHAPATARLIRPPGPREKVHALERSVGLPLPADLVELWTLTDGMNEHERRARTLVPNRFILLSATSARQEYERLSAASATDPACCGPDRTHRNRAGAGGPFCSAMVPFAGDGTGSLLCVDLRDGDDHGILMNRGPGDGFEATRWRSVTELLTEIAERLEPYVQGAEIPYREKHPGSDTEGIVYWQ
ncbi:SMI1/KNR4 family protein [Amycolatopsis azurea]|uniref:SMI1/KNR4 family protein n=1 Tax=Amycolatopsis azurea TaxID=36819 RepID=UPI00381E0215